MVTFKYWDKSDSSKEWPGTLIMEITLSDGALLSEADEIFKQRTGIDPRKKPYIGVQIFPEKKRKNN